MTNFKIWFVVAVFILAGIEFLAGYRSLRRHRNALYAHSEGAHAKKRRSRTAEKAKDDQLQARVIVAFIFGSIPITLAYRAFPELIHVAESFATIEQPFHKAASFTLFTLFADVIVASILVGINRLGYVIRKYQLDNEVDAFNEGARHSSSCSSVRYFEDADRLDDTDASLDDGDFNVERTTQAIKDGSARLKDPKAFQHESDNAARDHLYDTLGIADTQTESARDRLYAAYGITAD